MQDKSRKGSQSDDDEEEEEQEEGFEWGEQLPAWLTSMVFHMILLIVLALWGLTYASDKAVLVRATRDSEEPLEEEEELDDQKNLDAEVNTEILTQEIVFDDSPDFQIKTPNPDNTLVQPIKIDFDPNSTNRVKSGDLIGLVGGPGTGLGHSRNAGRAGAIRRGGGGGSGNAVEMGLRWIANHQYREGFWSFDHSRGNCRGRCPDPGSAKTRMGATGMSLLAFLGHGITHKDGGKKDEWRKCVERGLKYLIGHQGKGGMCFEPGGDSHEHMYSHGLCAMTLCEAFAMSQDPWVKKAAVASIRYIEFAQGPTGGWRYAPKADGDTSAVGWQIMAMKSAHLAYIKVSPQTLRNAKKFLDSVTADGAHYGYKTPDDRPKDGSTTAIALLCRMHLGWKKDNPGLVNGIQTLGNKGPTSNDMYYNYYGTLTQRMYGGDTGQHWLKWNPLMKGHLLKKQVGGNGHTLGSWMFNGALGDAQGGRLYNTAMAAMTLMVYYRYQPIYQIQAVENPFEFVD